MFDCWEIIGLEPTTDKSLIEQTYKSLIKKHKPHVDPDMFKKIRKAYEEIIEQLKCKETDGYASDNTYDIEDTNQIEDTKNKIINDDFENYNSKLVLIDYLLAIYHDANTRNNLEFWSNKLKENSFELLSEPTIGYMLAQKLIEFDFLYKTDLKLSSAIYVAIFDFFEIDEESYINEMYSEWINQNLKEELIKYRVTDRASKIIPTKFNFHNPRMQAECERVLFRIILNPNLTNDKFVENIIHTYQNITDQNVIKLMSILGWKRLIEVFLNPSLEINEIKAAYLYYYIDQGVNKFTMKKILLKQGYTSLDIKNCFKHYNDIYEQYIKLSWWRKIFRVLFKRVDISKIVFFVLLIMVFGAAVIKNL